MSSNPIVRDRLRCALESFRQGHFILLLDDTKQEQTGALVCAASAANSDRVNFLATHARGLICLALSAERVDELGLRRMGSDGQTDKSASYTVSIEAATGVSTGISAADRARTIAVAIDENSGPDDVVSPGHLFPVRVPPGGVLAVPSVVAAALDLAGLAECGNATSVYSQMLAENGELANSEELRSFAERHDVPIVLMTSVVRMRMEQECLVERLELFTVPTQFGDVEVSLWTNIMDGNHHVLVGHGTPNPGNDQPAPVVRMHSQCLTGDAFGSKRCDCGEQLAMALSRFREEPNAAILYLRQEGRGIGLVNKLKAYALQDLGRDTVEANLELGFAPDDRDYGIGAQILLAAGYERVRLMTNNPMKLADMQAFGIHVEERIPMPSQPNDANRNYLEVKRDKLGHLLDHL